MPHISLVIAEIMHACGHDGHTAILLGFAMLLQKYEAFLRRPIKLIFQQAEESTVSGVSLCLSRNLA